MNYEKIVRSEAKIRIMSALSILSIPIIQTLPIGEQGQFTNLQIYKLSNSPPKLCERDSSGNRHIQTLGGLRVGGVGRNQ